MMSISTAKLAGSVTCTDKDRVVAFTTPSNYAPRLRRLLLLHGWTPLWCPTVEVGPTPPTVAALRRYLSPSSLSAFSAIAFTSRAAISAFSAVLLEAPNPPLDARVKTLFTVAALGRDSELLDQDFVSRLCEDPTRIRVLVPPTATPTGLAEALNQGRGQRVLCPVPRVVGLEEPPVVPNFLLELASRGWIPERVDSYETRWVGPHCAEAVVKRSGVGDLDAVVFTSTGEVEGLLKSLRELGLEWGTLRERCPQLLVAAHGPVTAAGAQRLGVAIDVVSSRFDSFRGVVDALALRW